MKTSGVIFDFNGTLFFDSMMHAKAWQRFCSAHFGKCPSPDDIRDHFLGQTNSAILHRLTGDDTPLEVIDRLAREKEALYRQICREHPDDFHLTDGAAAFFELLKSRDIPMFIASGSEYDNFSFYMSELGLSQWFDWDNILYDDHSLPGKPDPAIYLKAAERMGMAPEKLTVFEDSTSGLTSAIRAGIRQVYAVVPADSEALAGHIDGVTGVIHDFRNAYRLL